MTYFPTLAISAVLCLTASLSSAQNNSGQMKYNYQLGYATGENVVYVMNTGDVPIMCEVTTWWNSFFANSVRVVTNSSSTGIVMPGKLGQGDGVPGPVANYSVNCRPYT